MATTSPDSTPTPGRRRLTRAVVGAVLLGALGLPVTPAQAAPVLVVNGTGDGADTGATRDGVCRAADGTCTLRAALQEANAAAGHVTINFALPGVRDASSPAGRIHVTSKPPVVTNPAGVTIDGYSQAGSSPNTAVHGSNAVIKVEIVGPGVTTTFDGLQFRSSNNVVRGLSIYQFKHSLWLEGDSANDNAIVGNFICTDATGVFGAQQLNGAAGGVLIQGGASRNVLGTPALADRNIISGCAHRGVIVSFLGTSFNKLQNNVFGLNPSGTAALPNQAHAMDVNYGARDTLVGGLGLFERNIVSGNMQSGIEVSHGTTNRRNNVLGNCVGTDLTCTKALSYTGNGMIGIRLEGEKTCNLTPEPPCGLNAGFSEVAHNVVVGNGWAADPTNGPPWGGLLIDKGQQHNWVHDNLIGVLPDGTPAGNTGYGVRIEHHAMYNRLGPNNEIAYSTLGGVQMLATASQPPDSSIYPTSANPVTRNSIHDNGGTSKHLGIDLPPLGVPNVNGVGDPNVAHAIQPPSISRLTGMAISGTGCPGCEVEVYLADIPALTSKASFGEGKTFLVSAVADADGRYSATFPVPLVSGQVVTANQTSVGEVDPAAPRLGAFGDTSEFARNIAVGGPVKPALQGPTSVNAAGVADVVVQGNGSGSASTAEGTLTDAQGTQVAAGPVEVDDAGDFALRFDASTLSDGPLTAAVSVADSTGQRSPAAEVGIAKDTVPAEVVERAPAQSATVASPAALRAVLSEAVGGTPEVALTGPQGLVAGTAAVSDDRMTVTFRPDTPLTSGTYASRLAVSDVAGNPTTSTAEFTVDADAPPAPTVTAPGTVTGANQVAFPVRGTAEPGATVTVSATGSGADASERMSQMVARADADSAWAADFDLSTFADGTVTLVAHARDAVGNTSPGGDLAVSKATVGPRLLSSSPAPGSTSTSPASVSMTFDAALAPDWSVSLVGAASGGAAGSTVLSDDGRTLTLTPDARLLSDTWTATAQVQDAQGNATLSRITFTVDADAPAAPSLTLPGRIDTGNVAGVPVSGATSAERDLVVDLVATGGSQTVRGTATTDGSGSWSTTLDLSALPDGRISVSATVHDAVGNRSPAAASEVAKQTLATAPAFKPFSWTVNSFTAAWAAPTDDGGSPVQSYLLSWTPADGATSTATVTSLSHVVGALPEGTRYTVTVAARTAAGLGAPTPEQVVTTKWKTTATIAPNPTRSLTAGQPVQLSGKVYRTSAPATVISGARLVVNQINQATGARARLVSNLLTRADGTWSYSYVPPTGSYKWQVTWVGDAVNGSAFSAPTGAVMVQ